MASLRNNGCIDLIFTCYIDILIYCSGPLNSMQAADERVMSFLESRPGDRCHLHHTRHYFYQAHCEKMVEHPCICIIKGRGRNTCDVAVLGVDGLHK